MVKSDECNACMAAGMGRHYGTRVVVGKDTVLRVCSYHFEQLLGAWVQFGGKAKDIVIDGGSVPV